MPRDSGIISTSAKGNWKRGDGFLVLQKPVLGGPFLGKKGPRPLYLLPLLLLLPSYQLSFPPPFLSPVKSFSPFPTFCLSFPQAPRLPDILHAPLNGIGFLRVPVPAPSRFPPRPGPSGRIGRLGWEGKGSALKKDSNSLAIIVRGYCVQCDETKIRRKMVCFWIQSTLRTLKY